MYTRKLLVCLFVAFGFHVSALAQDMNAPDASSGAAATVSQAPSADAASCLNKYPVTFFSKAQSAKTLGPCKLQFTYKLVYYDADTLRNAALDYRSIQGEDEKYTDTLCVRYGWLAGHNVALSIPYMFVNYHVGSTDLQKSGLSNIGIEEKWNFLPETALFPSLAANVFYYFGNGDTARKLGSDDYSWKLAVEASKAWPSFSLHANAGQTFSEGRDADKFEGAAVLLLTPSRSVNPGLEHNYTYTDSRGLSQDLIPAVIWSCAPGATLKAGAIVNADATTRTRDDIGFLMSLSYTF